MAVAGAQAYRPQTKSSGEHENRREVRLQHTDGQQKAEITEHSTFYQFFDSKGELYAEVLIAERDTLERRLEDAMADAESDRGEVSALLWAMFEEVRTNLLIPRLIIDNELRVVQEQLSEEDRQSIAANDPR